MVWEAYQKNLLSLPYYLPFLDILDGFTKVV